MCVLSAHPIPQPKQQVDQLSHFYTDHDRKSPYFTMGTHLPKIAPFHGRSKPPSNLRFLGPIQTHNPNGICISSAIFPQMTIKCPYTLQWDAPLPPKIALSIGDLDPCLIHGSRAHLSPQLKQHLYWFSRFCRAH